MRITPALADTDDPRAWRLDGYVVGSHDTLDIFGDLDWSKAWIDDGPSPAGNPGPYWKVPRRSTEQVHRLHPRKVYG